MRTHHLGEEPSFWWRPVCRDPVMMVRIHPHARDRMDERGATEEEVMVTVEHGERFSAKFGRVGFRRNCTFSGMWRGSAYTAKQLEVFAVQEDSDWLVIAVIVKYFGRKGSNL